MSSVSLSIYADRIAKTDVTALRFMCLIAALLMFAAGLHILR